MYNNPSVIQFTTFNEGDCVALFNASAVAAWAAARDPTRLIDTNSGGPANALYVQAVNDWHTYPYPGNPPASPTQYGMVSAYARFYFP